MLRRKSPNRTGSYCYREWPSPEPISILIAIKYLCTDTNIAHSLWFLLQEEEEEEEEEEDELLPYPCRFTFCIVRHFWVLVITSIHQQLCPVEYSVQHHGFLPFVLIHLIEPKSSHPKFVSGLKLSMFVRKRVWLSYGDWSSCLGCLSFFFLILSLSLDAISHEIERLCFVKPFFCSSFARVLSMESVSLSRHGASFPLHGYGGLEIFFLLFFFSYGFTILFVSNRCNAILLDQMFRLPRAWVFQCFIFSASKHFSQSIYHFCFIVLVCSIYLLEGLTLHSVLLYSCSRSLECLL